VDSVAAMDLKSNLEKDTDEPNKIGGVAKLMSDFFRKNTMCPASTISTMKRACVVGVNQTLTGWTLRKSNSRAKP
jgi:hypothetical protein